MAVALSGVGSAPKTVSGIGVSSIDWPARAMSMARLTAAAGAQSSSPGWVAVMVQLPAPSVTSAPSRMRQGPSVTKPTGRPEMAVALSGVGSAPKTVSGIGVSSID